jgi:hypothetical protein
LYNGITSGFQPEDGGPTPPTRSKKFFRFILGIFNLVDNRGNFKEIKKAFLILIYYNKIKVQKYLVGKY